MLNSVDVVVVGAGPTGLMAAAELALAGVEVVVIDQREEPDRTIKAGSISVASAELLDRRGLLPDSLAASGETLAAMGRFAAEHRPAGTWRGQLTASAPSGGGPAFPVAGHFAGMAFDPALVDQDDPVLRAHTAIAGSTFVVQRDVEALLARYAERLGVVIERGVEVRGVRSAGSGLADPAADLVVETGRGEIDTHWLVAADGGRSRIRKAAGISFEGTEPELTGYQAIVDVDRPELLTPGWTWTPHGLCTFGPLPGRVLTVQFTGPPADRDAPVTREELQASLRLVSETDVEVTAVHGRATRWTDNARQAGSYRSGRILLAGDAAHVHSPFSGQGLNLGLGDAANLGWKLAATLQGWAPPGLLDSYDRERRPIGAWVLNWTRAQVSLMRGDPKTGQLRDLWSHQLNDTALTTRLVTLTAGIDQTYDVGGGAGGDAAAGCDDAAARLGRPVGDLALADGERLADHAHAGRFVLLDRTADHRFGEVAAGWGPRVTAVCSPDEAGGARGVLIRPDGIVIWSGDAAELGSPTDLARLEEALRRWAGAPDVGTRS